MKRKIYNIYEIKHSKEMVKYQCKHPLNEESCKLFESRFKQITVKYVLYHGKDASSNWKIEYQDVPSFLKQLPDISKNL